MIYPNISKLSKLNKKCRFADEDLFRASLPSKAVSMEPTRCDSLCLRPRNYPSAYRWGSLIALICAMALCAGGKKSDLAELFTQK